MKKVFFLNFFFLFVSLYFAIPTIYATNLVNNPSFENNDTIWKSNNSAVTFSYTNDAATDGTMSARITNTKTSSYGIEHVLTDISSSLNYQISAFVKQVFPYPDKVLLRVAWYKSADATGSQVSTDDSNFAAAATDWQKLELIKTPPDGINSAKLRLLVASGSAYFDNILFTEYFAQIPTPTPTLPVGITSTPAPTPYQPVSYDRVYLSEVMVNPPAGQEEWVEIYNDNDFPVSLTHWYIDDGENEGSAPKVFSLDIATKSYAAFDLSSSIFNNASDTVRLLDFNKDQKDSFSYTTSQKEYSLGRISTEDQTFCSQLPTKGTPNSGCISPSTMEHPVITSLKTKPTTFPTPAPLLKSKPHYITGTAPSNQPTVLGEMSQNDDEQPPYNAPGDKKLVKLFSSLSACYSLLTLASVLLKMKSTV